MRIAFIHPFTAHYRKDFFKKLSIIYNLDLLSIEPPTGSDYFLTTEFINEKIIKTIIIGPFKWFNPFISIIKQCSVLIIVWQPSWLPMYIILLLRSLFSFKIILWTHGISVKHGFHPDSIRDRIKLLFFNMADGISFYTKNELKILAPYLKKTNLFYVNNTLNVKKIQKVKSALINTHSELREKYGIIASRVVIYCARFIKDRRPDLLVKFIEMMRVEDVSFIIVGDGLEKPDFSVYQSVYDFGALYDEKTKAELYSVSDFSFQPAWTGLSVVESMANGIPYITLEKNNDILQCVEYAYINNGVNGFISHNLSDVRDKIIKTSNNDLARMKNNCLEISKRELSMQNMINNFKKGIVSTLNKK